MDSKYSGYGQVPPELKERLGLPADANIQFDPEKIKRRVMWTVIGAFLPFIVIGVVILTALFLPNYFSGFMEVFDSGPIKGTMFDLTYVPDDSGKGKVWLVTNPSFTYVQTVETPGSYSMSTECVGCKIRVYIYDQATEEIVDQWDIAVNGLPYDADLYYGGGAVWLSARDSSSNAPFIYKYQAQNGEVLYNTESFVAEHSELTGSVIELMQFENPYRYNLKLSDGKKFIYVIDEDKFYPDEAALNDSLKADETVNLFVLTEESSTDRTILYSLTGPKNKVMDGHCDTYVDEEDTLDFFCEATAKKLSDEVFLDAYIVYRDAELAVIIHQNSLGTDAKRQLPAYNIEGEKLWTIPQEQLFDEMRFSPEDPFSETFFIKSDFTAERSGNVFVFIMEGVGAAAFDTADGRPLWIIRP